MLRTTTTEAKNWLENLTAKTERINAKNARSAWSRGVGAYALELLNNLTYLTDEGNIPETWRELKTALLNGADDWQVYSEGGCALICDFDIAKRLCNPSELKRTDDGRKEPNARESWLDVQTRALFQASFRLLHAFHAEV